MPKFSIVVPVYNVEDYIEACLDSILNQTFTDFEVIVVNDGTKDHSDYFIELYAKKDHRIRAFKKKNGGLSSARNYGVKKARGEYLLFVDSDDTIESDLLKKLNQVIKKQEVDVVRFGINEVNEFTKKTTKLPEVTFDVCKGEDAFQKLISVNNLLVEPAWAYLYRKEFWIKNKFQYALGKIHEDFGLTPYVLMKASSVVSISYYGYNYLIRENSIMTNSKEEQLIRRANDLIFHFDSLISKIDELSISSESKKVYGSFLANVLLSKSIIVPKSYLDIYIEELKKRNIGNYLLDDTLKRKLKKLLIKINMKYYINKYARKIK